jgi:serine/threonine protein kinase
MEMLEGESLLDELERSGTVSASRAAAIAIPVCDVLEEAHAAGVIHRDIKPSNIFLQRTPRGEVTKLLDFGIAKIADQAGGKDITMAGSVLGTLAYMAPERFGTKPIDGRSDVYSLGVTLYQMLCGRPPFLGREGDPMGLIMRHVNEPPPPLREMNPELSEAVEAAVMQTLRKKPGQRPSAAELAANLARAIGQSPPQFVTGRGPAAQAVNVDGATRVAPGTVPADPGTAPAEFTPVDSGTAAFDPRKSDDEA